MYILMKLILFLFVMFLFSVRIYIKLSNFVIFLEILIFFYKNRSVGFIACKETRQRFFSRIFHSLMSLCNFLFDILISQAKSFSCFVQFSWFNFNFWFLVLTELLTFKVFTFQDIWQKFQVEIRRRKTEAN